MTKLRDSEKELRGYYSFFIFISLIRDHFDLFQFPFSYCKLKGTLVTRVGWQIVCDNLLGRFLRGIVDGGKPVYLTLAVFSLILHLVAID